MTIQFNTDKSLTMHEAFATELKAQLEHDLNHFSEHITRLELHLSDENGHKQGVDDKRCVMEARIANHQPVAVTADGSTHEQSVKAATDKLKSALNTILGKMTQH